MDEAVTTLFSVFAVLALVFFNGFFVAVEFAIVRSHPSRLRGAEFAGKFGVRSSLRLIEDLDLSLSATQLGITIASLLLGWWGEHTFAQLFYSSFLWWGATGATIASHFVASFCALVVITFLHVVLGELAAKSVAIRHPEHTLRFLADSMLIFALLCKPLVVFLTACANSFLKLFGMNAPAEAERVHSAAELKLLVSHSTQEGILDKDEEEMLHGVFGFSNTIAREVMTPRTDVVTIKADYSLDDIVKRVVSAGYSRFPVVGRNIDDVLGILLAKDLLSFVSTSSPEQKEQFDLRSIIRPSYFIPETKAIDDLLNEFKRRKVHLAVVVDEHGGVAGIATLEDLLEEIVGEIFDEKDVTEEDVIHLEDGDVLLQGGVLVEDANSQFELRIPEGDYDTIAGFIFATLGRMPKKGDEIVISQNGLVFVNGIQVMEGSANGSAAMVGQAGGSSLESLLEAEPYARLTIEKLIGRSIKLVRVHRYNPENYSESEEVPETSEQGKAENQE